MKALFRVLFLFCPMLPAVLLPVSVQAQEHLRIYHLQGEGSESPYQGKEVRTEGIVTLTLFAPGQLNGFFLQDTLGDGSDATSDGIFVYGQENVEAGDYICLTAKVSEYSARTQLSEIRELRVVKKNLPLPARTIRFPEDLSLGEDYERFEGMLLRIPHPLYLNSTYALLSEGSVELGSERLRTPTDFTLAGSDAWREATEANRRNRLILDDGSTRRNPAPVPFLDADGTCRTGQRIDSLWCVADQIDAGYKVYALRTPEFYGNARTDRPDETALGNYTLKVCGFNLEMFFDASPLQRTRIIRALAAIDADLFGLVEVGGGRKVIDSLVAALNRAKGGSVYDYIRWTGYEPNSTYTLNHILYRKDRLEPYDKYFMINSVSPANRKLIQAFRDLADNEVFIYSINHFKAKSGTGTGGDADQGDGQGSFNYRRIQEAYAVLDKISQLRYYYETDRVLVMGDLNAMYREDPIRIFTEAGYEDQVHRFSDSYTYCFDGQVQYLDYSLASPALQPFVTGATVWHIDADEPAFMDYDRDADRHEEPYRVSDHDPVIVGLNFRQAVTPQNPPAPERLAFYPNPARDYVSFGTEVSGYLEVYTAGGLPVLRRNLAEAVSGFCVRGWQAGLYVVRLCAENGKVYYGKLSIL